MLTTLECLDDAHLSTAIGARFFEGERLKNLCCFVFCNCDWFSTEQCSDSDNVGFTFCAGQQAVVTDTMEAVGENVDQKSPVSKRMTFWRLPLRVR